MNRPHANLLIATATLTAFIAAASYLAYILLSDSDDEPHYEREETKLTVTNLSGARLEVFRAGPDLSSATRLDDFNDGDVWLDKGDYFIRAIYEDGEVLYPVNIIGYNAGPERDGSVAVTVRPRPAETPHILVDGVTSFRFIPPGYFLMGDRLNPNEPHYVWTQGFFIGEFEVSNIEFRQFIDSLDGYSANTNWPESGLEWRDRSRSHTSATYLPTNPEFERFGRDDMPVTEVTWFEATAYCNWLTTKYGNGRWVFSLPTEADWEKAARGPDGFDYPLGRRLSDGETSSYNWKKNPLATRTVFGVGESKTMFQPNRWGFYHLGGNVVEWTSSVYRQLNREHPYNEDDRNDDDQPGSRVARGGSWYSASNALLYIAYRDAFEPELSHNDLGFRIVARYLP